RSPDAGAALDETQGSISRSALTTGGGPAEPASDVLPIAYLRLRGPVEVVVRGVVHPELVADGVRVALADVRRNPALRVETLDVGRRREGVAAVRAGSRAGGLQQQPRDIAGAAGHGGDLLGRDKASVLGLPGGP